MQIIQNVSFCVFTFILKDAFKSSCQAETHHSSELPKGMASQSSGVKGHKFIIMSHLSQVLHLLPPSQQVLPLPFIHRDLHCRKANQKRGREITHEEITSSIRCFCINHIFEKEIENIFWKEECQTLTLNYFSVFFHKTSNHRSHWIPTQWLASYSLNYGFTAIDS